MARGLLCLDDMPTNLDPTNLAAVSARATYLSTMFGQGGRRGGRWHFSTWAHRAFSEQIAEHGSISDGYLKELTTEVPAEVVAECIELPAPPRDTDGCGGKGYHWVYDTDYPCSGCYACRAHRDPWVIVAWWVGVMVWALATSRERAELHRGVLAMQALSRVGAAVEAALSPGRGVSRWLTATVQEWNTIRIGRWYRVAGRRGRAKEHHGAEGEVVRLEHAAGRLGGVGTLRAALRIPGESRWAWVPASSLEPAHVPAEAARIKEREKRSKAQIEAARAKRPDFAGSKGDAVYVIDGPGAGKNGAVMWMGPGREGPRVGVRFGAGEKDIAWCSAKDVVGGELAGLVAASRAMAADAGSLLTKEEEALIDTVVGTDDAARLPLADSLEARGFTGLAAAWRGNIPVPTPRRTRAPRGRAAMSVAA